MRVKRSVTDRLYVARAFVYRISGGVLCAGEGPVANWKAHIADPSNVNGFTEVFATRFTPGN